MRRLAIVLLLALLTACAAPVAIPDSATDEPAAPEATAAPGAPPAAPADETTISFAAWEHERAIYEPLIARFHAENPAINVVLTPLEDIASSQSAGSPDSPQALLRRLVSSADTGPAFFTAPETINSQLLLNLAPLMDADANFKRDDFYPGALERYTIGGDVRILPRTIAAPTLAYNKELLQGANLPDPQPGWSWSDLLAASEQIARRNGSRIETYGFLDQSSGVMPMLALLQAQGIDLLNPAVAGAPLDRPEIVAAARRVRDLADSGALLEPGVKRDGDFIDMRQFIRDGKVGIWGLEMLQEDTPPGAQPEPLGFAIGAAPYPSFAGGLLFFGGDDGYLISAGTQHPNEAWKWIEFLSRQPVNPADGQSKPGGGAPGRIPARKSLAEQIGYWKNIDPATAAAYQWVVAHPVPPRQQTPDYNALGALSQALSQIIGERKDPQKALADAQKQMIDQIAQAQLTPTPPPDNSPVLVSTPEPQSAPAGATSITFAVPGYSATDMRRITRAFRELRPDIFIKITATDNFTGPLQLPDVARTSDCLTWFTPPQSDADFKALLDLRPLFDADATFARSDYALALMSPYQRNGGIFGLPYAANLRTLNYNRTRFAAAGIKPPSDAWTPADFLAAAQALTSGSGDKKQYGYVPLGGPAQDLFFFIGQFGGQLLGGDGGDPQPNFADPKVVAAIQWYLDLSKTHGVMPPVAFPYRRDQPPGPPQPSGEDPYELAANGRAAMWFDQGYGAFSGPKDGPPGSARPLSFEIGVAPLPIGAGGLHSGDFYLRGFHISAQTKEPQACWEFLKFLSNDVSNLQGGIPARTSIAASGAFAQQAPPGLADVYAAYAEALKRESRPGADPNTLYGQKFDMYWFFKAISATIDEGADLQSGMDEAQKTTAAYLDCLSKGGKPGACATQVDPTYQGYMLDDPERAPLAPRG